MPPHSMRATELRLLTTGGVVSISKPFTLFGAGERVAGGMRGSVGGDHFELVAAIGD